MSHVVIGAGGGIGRALAELMESGGRQVMRFGRGSTPPLDLLDESSMANAARTAGTGLRLVIVATGFLGDARFTPEKNLRQLDGAQLAYSFAVNATGPALVMKHFLPLLARGERAVFAVLSARVGSIADNHLGGWYGYRASKAALNQLVRTAAIEIARTHKHAICIALHPGTVDTKLSRPFVKAGLDVQSPDNAARRLLRTIDAVQTDRSGLLLDADGNVIAF
jgi:NAD(P)-dependent dehydrogenase (short-subunit alcohol dehydrogenase family)